MCDCREMIVKGMAAKGCSLYRGECTAHGMSNPPPLCKGSINAECFMLNGGQPDDVVLRNSLTYFIFPVHFFRTCKLSSSNFTMASVDILYIDITRRWSGAMPDSREAGKRTHTQTNNDACRNKIITKGKTCRGQRAGSILETRSK